MRVYFYDLKVTGFHGEKIGDMRDSFPENICVSDGVDQHWYTKKYYNKAKKSHDQPAQAMANSRRA